MVQFNLLPDVKLQFIKARRTKRLMSLVSVIVIGVSLFVFLLMMTTVNVVQKKSLSDLNKDVKKYSNELKSTKDLDKILTVQNQLSTLTDLHDKNPVSSRIFTYLAQLTPPEASLNKLNLDFAESTITITGQATSLDKVNTFIDTLKATTYTTTDNTDATPAFTAVVLSAFSRNSDGASFTINMNFDPIIFNGASEVSLKVPSKTTADPATLFQNGAEN